MECVEISEHMNADSEHGISKCCIHSEIQCVCKYNMIFVELN